jgi:hypothetical protein
MRFNQIMIDEFTLLAKFPRDSKMQGIKLHSDAEPNLLSAAQRLFDKIACLHLFIVVCLSQCCITLLLTLACFLIVCTIFKLSK